MKLQVVIRHGIAIGFVVGLIPIWYFDLAPDPKWGVTPTAFLFGFACAAAMYFWERSRRPKW